MKLDDGASLASKIEGCRSASAQVNPECDQVRWTGKRGKGYEDELGGHSLVYSERWQSVKPAGLFPYY